jgi:hypothetical protein
MNTSSDTQYKAPQKLVLKRERIRLLTSQPELIFTANAGGQNGQMPNWGPTASCTYAPNCP